jgi:hypothetical protein
MRCTERETDAIQLCLTGEYGDIVRQENVTAHIRSESANFCTVPAMFTLEDKDCHQPVFIEIIHRQMLLMVDIGWTEFVLQ